MESILTKPPASQGLPCTLSRIETRALYAIYQPLLPFPLITPTTTDVTGPVWQYRLRLKSIKGGLQEPIRWANDCLPWDQVIQWGGSPNKPVVGAMLFRGNGGKDFMTNLSPFGGKEGEALRFLKSRAVEKPPGGVQLLSCLGWDSDKGQLTFYMLEKDFRAMTSSSSSSGNQEDHYSILLFRTDNYDIMSFPSLLSEATTVTPDT